ncbi:MAG: hypothetical protein M3R52_03505 [Acidobacteriota bacterium]|nr:hypothetical protein [Acidobacteriota bacterium]
MNRNQKIALGCGGAGCLGLVAVVIVVVVLSVTGYLSRPGVSSYNRNRNSNYNSNRNSNFDSTSNLNSNSNSSSSSSTMSSDDKHKLFQAVGATKDDQLLLKVLARIGFPNASGNGYDQFMEEHAFWALKNFEFMDTVNTPEKGRAYVEAHLDD